MVKAFGSTRALDGIDVQVPQGTVVGLLGPNGAGKTTAVRILSTLLRPDAGWARVAGVEMVLDHATDLPEVAVVLAEIGTGEPTVNAQERRTSIVVDGGAKSLIEALRRLDLQSIPVQDVGLHRPTPGRRVFEADRARRGERSHPMSAVTTSVLRDSSIIT